MNVLGGIFDVKVEKPGPGAASVYDPEFKQRHEGVSPRHVTSLPHKVVAGIMNDPGTLHARDVKLEKYPKSIQSHYEDVRNAVSRWQGHGGFSSGIGIAAEKYIRGYGVPNDPSGSAAIAIVNAIRNAPERSGILYRGMTTEISKPIESFESMKPGDVLRIDRPSSFSHRLGAAKGFYASEPGSHVNSYRITIVDRYKGLDAKASISYNDENEVITYGRFKVVHKFTDRKGVKNIVVRQLEVHAEIPDESDYREAERALKTLKEEDTTKYIEDYANPHD